MLKFSDIVFFYVRACQVRAWCSFSICDHVTHRGQRVVVEDVRFGFLRTILLWKVKGDGERGAKMVRLKHREDKGPRKSQNSVGQNKI